VLGEVALLVVVGLAFGLPMSMILGRLVSSQLYGLSPMDPATLVSATAFLLSVALVAAYLPARRATGVDPTTALRHE
jgi:putative ABC transport system permease protein